MKTSKTITADQWEAAWGEYVEALERWELARPNLYRPRHVRETKRIRKEYFEAKERLRKMDPEFCERNGI